MMRNFHYIILGQITDPPNVTLLLSTSLLDPQAFVLAGDTSGGPPTTYTWRKDGMEISADDVNFNISIAVKGREQDTFLNSLYRSVLTVTGRQGGVYEYSVTNEATSGMMTTSFTVEGMYTVRV